MVDSAHPTDSESEDFSYFWLDFDGGQCPPSPVKVNIGTNQRPA